MSAALISLPKLRIDESDIFGLGCFADENLTAGTIVALEGPFGEQHFRGQPLWIRLNHRCVNPNLEWRLPTESVPYYHYVAIHDIKKGEELTFDYRMSHWSSFYTQFTEPNGIYYVCGCRCPDCRGENSDAAA